MSNNLSTITDFENKKYDIYGRKVYSGPPLLKNERFFVWYGYSKTRLTSPKEYSFKTFKQAIRFATKLQKKGFFVQITDRLIEEE